MKNKTQRPRQGTEHAYGGRHGAVALDSPQSARLARMQAMIDASPVMAAQKKRLDGISGVGAVDAARPVQRIIVTGKTARSKPVGILKATDWYKELDSDDHRAFAVALHAEDKKYTKDQAKQEIQKRIDRGDEVPDNSQSAKEIRLKRIREYINANAPKLSDNAYVRGRHLANAGARAYRRLGRKYKRKAAFEQDVKAIKKRKPGLYADQRSILTDRLPWQQIFALTHSQPVSYEFNLGGDKVTLDSIDVKSHVTRSEERPSPSDPLNLAQVFVDQKDGMNSYWKMADSNDTSLRDDSAHKKLRHLEAERDPMAAFTTYMKDDLFENGHMNTTEAYGDEGVYAYQEYKGALNPTGPMRRMQLASSHWVLEKALKRANRMLGTQVESHEMTTAQTINDSLQAFMTDKTRKNYRALVKEMFRLIRAQTEMDIESDTDSETDDELASELK